MTTEELLEKLNFIQKMKCETQILELKAAEKGCPKRLYDSLSSFSNQDEGGVIVFGVDEEHDYKEVGVYDPQDIQKKINEQCLQMEPVVRPLLTVVEKDEKFFVSAEIPGIDLVERPCHYKGQGRIKGSYTRIGDSDEPMTEYEVYSYEAFRKKYQDDIREVVAYAATLGIDVIPEIDMPGHSLKVVESYPWLSCGAKAGWGQHFSVPLCPGNDEALAFAKAVYSEIFDLFPYGYVHIGADEVERSHWKKCEKCQARMRALGLEDEAGLQAWFVGQMQDFFEANGKTLIGWDEIVAGGVSKDAVVMWWRGWRPDSRTEAVENGNDVIISSSEYLYLSGDQNRNSLMKVYDWDPVADGLSDHENQVLGMQAHVWTELCPSWENACGRIFPRLFAVSETAWSMPSRKDRDGFLKRVNTHLRRFDSQGINYRIPDISGFCDVNVFVDSTTIEISRPFDDVVVRYTLDGSVPRSDSPVYEAPITVKSSAVLHFRPYTSSGMPGDIYRAEYLPASYQEPLLDTTDELACGLKTDWYEYRGESCDSITTVAFNSSYVTEGIYIPEEVKGNIGLVFEGYVNIPEDGIYSFYTYSDDGSFIKINDEMVVANDGPHSRVEKNGQAALKKGLHKLEARYFDSSGGILEAGFILPDGTRRKFTAGDFFH